MAAAIDPRDVACPACFAPAHTPCTRPTDSGRDAVSWTHYSRQNAANAVALARGDVPVHMPHVEQGGFLVLRRDGNVTLHQGMLEAEAVAVVEHAAVYAITLHRDYRD
jgi:hypothetical protein